MFACDFRFKTDELNKWDMDAILLSLKTTYCIGNSYRFIKNKDIIIIKKYEERKNMKKTHL